MQVPRLQKIVINQGVGQAVADKKLIEVAQAELTCHLRPESRSDRFEERYFQL
jgi:ribosomal protein L5